MRKLKLFTHCTILATTPTFLVHPQHNPQILFQLVNQRLNQPLPVHQTVSWLGDWNSQEQEELPGTILLSSDDSITGKLHVINIKSIEVNEKPFFGILTKDYDSAEILDFEMENHSTLLLGIQWGNYPPKARVDNFSTIIIKAEKMWWENIPDLEA